MMVKDTQVGHQEKNQDAKALEMNGSEVFILSNDNISVIVWLLNKNLVKENKYSSAL